MFEVQFLLQNPWVREVPFCCGILSCFLLWRRATSDEERSFSRRLTLLFLADFQPNLSSAKPSHFLTSMWHFIMLLFHVSLNLNFGLPLGLPPCASSPKSSCLRIRTSFIRLTRSSHLSIFLHKITLMSGSLAWSRTSVFVICHLMPRIVRRLIQGETNSCPAYSFQVSEPCRGCSVHKFHIFCSRSLSWTACCSMLSWWVCQMLLPLFPSWFQFPHLNTLLRWWWIQGSRISWQFPAACHLVW